MFEDSLFESRVDSVSASKGWTALASISLQFAVAAVVIALPLLHPEALPFHAGPPKLLLPLTPKPPIPIVRVNRAPTASASLAAPELAQRMVIRFLPNRSPASDETPTLAPIGVGMGGGETLSALALGDSGHGTRVTLASMRAATGPVHVSTGVSQGMLIAPIRPIYPPIAKAAHVEGKVIVEAVISRTGTIESLHVVSGPSMLQRAAIDAIQAAHYQPYRLNGEATAVETTITVNFRLGS